MTPSVGLGWRATGIAHEVNGRAVLKRTLALCSNEAERRRLERRLGEVGVAGELSESAAVVRLGRIF